MREFILLRASETFGEGRLVSFLKEHFPNQTRLIGKSQLEGMACVETSIAVGSPEFHKLARFVQCEREKRRLPLTIGRYMRKYTPKELANADLFSVQISSVFEPAGAECGTMYDETLRCTYCGAGRKQESSLVLDLRKAPRSCDISRTISHDEIIVSKRFAEAFNKNKMKGAEFLPVFDFRNPETASPKWHQMKILGNAGAIAPTTSMGMDPFANNEKIRHCPRGHSLAANLLSELRLHRNQWDKSDIAATKTLLGMRENLLVPNPVIVISARLFHLMQANRFKGLESEIAHLD